MIFEIGKQYIVSVTENRIVSIEEFSKERYFDKEHDSIDFLTDEEKEVIINNVLDEIKAEIEAHRRKTKYIDPYDLVGDCLDIIDKYKIKNEKGAEE